MKRLKFEDLRDANASRQAFWPGNEKADVAFRAIEVAGETGELMEQIKKYLRKERGIKGSTADKSALEAEFGDVIIAVDLLAQECGINLAKAVSKKFNATSVKYNMPVRLDDDGKKLLWSKISNGDSRK